MSPGDASMTVARAGLLLLCLLAPVAREQSRVAEPVTPAEARERWLRGSYEEAEADYEALAKDPKTKSLAAIGLSRVLQSQGHHDRALAAVESALAEAPKDGNLLARKADLLYFRGRWDDALTAAEAAIA